MSTTRNKVLAVIGLYAAMVIVGGVVEYLRRSRVSAAPVRQMQGPGFYGPAYGRVRDGRFREALYQQQEDQHRGRQIINILNTSLSVLPAPVQGIVYEYVGKDGVCKGLGR